MAYKRQGATLSMSKLREIIRLHELGHNKSEIARSCLYQLAPKSVILIIC